MNTETPLKAIAFFDTRPGHEKQTSGILKSLAGLTPLEVETVTVAIPSFTTESHNWLRFLFKRSSCPFKQRKEYDFIIGTGTYTHIPMLSCKRELEIPVFTCMSPSSLLLKKIDLCFIPNHDTIRPQQNIFFTNGPPNPCRPKNKHDKHKGLIVVGGVDNKSHRWNNPDLIGMITKILSREAQIQWIISSSPRTPNETILGLQELASGHNNSLFVPFKDTRPGWIEKQYDSCRTVWVTADSMSMVYESLSSGCRVGILPVSWKKANSKFQRNEHNLSTRGLVLSFDKWLGKETFSPGSNSFNEAELCAKEILKRWWPNRLQ